jgi:hypothetical protein
VTGEQLAILAAQALAAALVLLVLVGRHRWRRHVSFDATIARAHPELPALPVHHDLAQVAAQAINVHTPPAPRVLGGWERLP